MIHIRKSKDKKFYVVVTGKNGEVLSTSETLNSKQAAWKNINALKAIFQLYTGVMGITSFGVKDETIKK